MLLMCISAQDSACHPAPRLCQTTNYYCIFKIVSTDPVTESDPRLQFSTPMPLDTVRRGRIDVNLSLLYFHSSSFSAPLKDSSALCNHISFVKEGSLSQKSSLSGPIFN